MNARSQISHAGMRRHRLVRAVHAGDEVVVRHRLVDEPPPGGVDRDQAGLGAVEREMRIGAAAAVEPAVSDTGVQNAGAA